MSVSIDELKDKAKAWIEPCSAAAPAGAAAKTNPQYEAVIAEMGSNINQVEVQERDTRTSTLSFLFQVHDRDHLARVMRRIRGMPQVMRVYRART